MFHRGMVSKMCQWAIVLRGTSVCRRVMKQCLRKWNTAGLIYKMLTKSTSKITKSTKKVLKKVEKSWHLINSCHHTKLLPTSQPQSRLI